LPSHNTFLPWKIGLTIIAHLPFHCFVNEIEHHYMDQSTFIAEDLILDVIEIIRNQLLIFAAIGC
jgi:hypothetical protein